MDKGLQVLVPLMNYYYYYRGNNGFSFRLYHPVGGNLKVSVCLHEQAVVSEQEMSDGSLTVGVCGVWGLQRSSWQFGGLHSFVFALARLPLRLVSCLSPSLFLSRLHECFLYHLHLGDSFFI